MRAVSDFRERAAGEWAEDFAPYCIRQWADLNDKLPGGESLRETQRRNIEALFKALADYPGQNLVIGAHGTALSMAARYFDPHFGYEDFERIRPLMPCVARFDFRGIQCVHIEFFDVFRCSGEDASRQAARGR